MVPRCWECHPKWWSLIKTDKRNCPGIETDGVWKSGVKNIEAGTGRSYKSPTCHSANDARPHLISNSLIFRFMYHSRSQPRKLLWLSSAFVLMSITIFITAASYLVVKPLDFVAPAASPIEASVSRIRALGSARNSVFNDLIWSDYLDGRAIIRGRGIENFGNELVSRTAFRLYVECTRLRRRHLF